MPSTTFTFALRVPLYDLDVRDELPCAALFRYFEETAIQASMAAGFDREFYRQRGQFWVIRNIRMERLCAARNSDQLLVTTWVSAMSRIRADRSYLVRRVSDNRLIARATANWVYLDASTLFPARIAPEIVARFQDVVPPALPAEHDRRAWLKDGEPMRSTVHRCVQHYEADSTHRTNNAVYVDWLEEAVRQICLAHGYSLPLGGNPTLWFRGHGLEYLNPTRPRDDLEIQTGLVGRGRSAARWEHEIRRVPARELVMKASSTTVWLDARDRVMPWPRPNDG